MTSRRVCSSLSYFPCPYLSAAGTGTEYCRLLAVHANLRSTVAVFSVLCGGRQVVRGAHPAGRDLDRGHPAGSSHHELLDRLRVRREADPEAGAARRRALGRDHPRNGGTKNSSSIDRSPAETAAAARISWTVCLSVNLFAHPSDIDSARN